MPATAENTEFDIEGFEDAIYKALLRYEKHSESDSEPVEVAPQVDADTVEVISENLEVMNGSTDDIYSASMVGNVLLILLCCGVFLSLGVSLARYFYGGVDGR